MSDPRTQEFLDRLTVADQGSDRFTGSCAPAWPGRAFGGQLAAQSLHAAAGTTPDPMVPWSLHLYFHAPVRSNDGIDYEVQRVKDGRTTASRQVRIMQDGKLRATAMALFGVPAEGPTHQYQRPETPGPESIASEERLIHPTIVPPDSDFESLGYPAESLVDLRVVGSQPDAVSPFERKVWMRVVPPLPSDPVITAAAQCYLSDITLGTTVLEPHGGRDQTTDLQLGAVELALWFTAPAQLSEWTLFSQDSAFAGGGHGLAHGVFYNSGGEVSAVALQNALMRHR